MSVTTLSRTRTVLNRVRSVEVTDASGRDLGVIGEPAGRGFYAQPAEPGEDARRHIVIVDADVYEDMGRPDTITVTIEPGDRLNE